LKLAEAVGKRRSYLIGHLTFDGFDPEELNSLTLTELEKLNIKIGRKARPISKEGRGRENVANLKLKRD